MKVSKIPLYLLLALVSAGSFVQGAEEESLKDVFAGDFFIGAALNERQIFGKIPKETSLVIDQFNTITPENILKWERVHPNPDRYDFAAADALVALGQKHKMFIVGHCLVWHSQTPPWVFKDIDGKPSTREQLLTQMKDHIFTVVGRYKGMINGWDVVNEAVEGDGTLRKSKWLSIIGDDFIAKAFEYAHQADPEAELYYNDYDMWKKEHREGVIRLVKDLKEKGIRINGIGMQGHWGLDYPSMKELEESIIAYSELGVQVMITELDVTVLPSAWRQGGADINQNFQLRKELNPYPDNLPEEIQKKLADRYAEIFTLFNKHTDKINRVTFWGVQDGNSWRNNWPVRGRTDYPLIFDRNCEPKLAFNAIVETVQEKK